MTAVDLPPELIDHILRGEHRALNLTADVQESQRTSFTAFLVGASQISRRWYQQTRRYLFARLIIRFGSKSSSSAPRPTGALRRLCDGVLGKRRKSEPNRGTQTIEEFLRLVAANPGLADHVHKLAIISDGSEATKDLNHSSAALWALLGTPFPSMSSLEIAWGERRWETGSEHRWWDEELSESTRAVLRRMLSMKRFTSLKLTMVKVPPSVWMTNDSLQDVVLGDQAFFIDEGLNNAQPRRPTLTSLALQSDLFEHWWRVGTLLRVPQLPLFLGALTKLQFGLGLPWLPDIQQLFLAIQGTLTHLVCSISMFERDQDAGGNIDLSGMRAIRTLHLQVFSSQVTHSVPTQFVARTLGTLNWHHVEELSLRVEYRCPWGGHPLYDARPVFADLDDLISSRTLADGTVDEQAWCVLERVVIHEKPYICQSCVSLNMALPARSWDSATLMPRLHQRSSHNGRPDLQVVFPSWWMREAANEQREEKY